TCSWQCDPLRPCEHRSDPVRHPRRLIPRLGVPIDADRKEGHIVDGPTCWLHDLDEYDPDLVMQRLSLREVKDAMQRLVGRASKRLSKLRARPAIRLDEHHQETPMEPMPARPFAWTTPRPRPS